VTTSAPATSILASRANDVAIAPRRALHRFACIHVLATFVLLIAGARVTSNDAGISVVDWPSSLGFFNPIAVHLRGLMHGLVAIEHGHREIAMVVGLLTIVEAIWLWRTGEQTLRTLGVLLLIGVLVQGGLGGLTVKMKLPPAVSIAHGMLAQSFFCLSIATAALLAPRGATAALLAPRASGSTTSRPGSTGASSAGLEQTGARATFLALRRASVVTMAIVFGQLFLGAFVRHTVAKWRVPTFADLPVMVHAAFAAAVLVSIGMLVARSVATASLERAITRPALALGGLVVAQAILGVLAVATRTDPLITVLHVVIGAAILGTCVMLAVRSGRLAAAAADVARPPTEARR
jgi:cytochrome c oxidase assembly protein subunit 15